ncbi:MAG: DUF4276 family protein [Gammaproteobacteria bacterium]|nr:DUF4276 family protein [Gammaproteobacteria bacterium]MDE0367993.1 DUF4276 family protein [Gammaproteobacteria bacterium]
MTARVLYVEGGGKGKASRSECRQGFAGFLERAGLKGRLPKIVSCDARQSAFDDFRHAVANPAKDRIPLLLVDSEGPVASGESAWRHLKKQDNWTRPEDAPADSAHLMVECMESWFLADKESLSGYFGPKFNENVLPGDRNIEAIPKQDVLRGLREATRRCPKKGAYDKGRHAFAILKSIDPSRVRKFSSHAKHLIETLERPVAIE